MLTYKSILRDIFCLVIIGIYLILEVRYVHYKVKGVSSYDD